MPIPPASITPFMSHLILYGFLLEFHYYSFFVVYMSISNLSSGLLGYFRKIERITTLYVLNVAQGR